MLAVYSKNNKNNGTPEITTVIITPKAKLAPSKMVNALLDSRT